MNQWATARERNQLPVDERVPPSQRTLQLANEGREVLLPDSAAVATDKPKKRNLRREIEEEYSRAAYARDQAAIGGYSAPPPAAAAAVPVVATQPGVAPPAKAIDEPTAITPDETSAKVAQAAERQIVDNGVGVIDDAAAVLHDSPLWQITEAVWPNTMVQDVQQRCGFALFACQDADWAWPIQPRARPLGPTVLKRDWPTLPVQAGRWPSPGCPMESKHLKVILLCGDKTGSYPGCPQRIPVVVHRGTGAAYMLWSHAAVYVGVDVMTLRNMARMAFHNSSAILTCPQAIQLQGADAETVIQRAMEQTSIPEGINPRSAHSRQRSVLGLPLLVAMLRALRAVKQSCTVKMRDGALAV